MRGDRFFSPRFLIAAAALTGALASTRPSADHSDRREGWSSPLRTFPSTATTRWTRPSRVPSSPVEARPRGSCRRQSRRELLWCRPSHPRQRFGGPWAGSRPGQPRPQRAGERSGAGPHRRLSTHREHSPVRVFDPERDIGHQPRPERGGRVQQLGRSGGGVLPRVWAGLHPAHVQRVLHFPRRRSHLDERLSSSRRAGFTFHLRRSRRWPPTATGTSSTPAWALTRSATAR